MPLSTDYAKPELTVSFELFPPKTDAGQTAMMKHVEKLMEFAPSYITCTYGAGGSTRGKTLDIVSQVKQQFKVPVASHLTCVAATVDYLREYLKEASERGVDYIVALRGDPPQGETEFKQAKGGLGYANELVELIAPSFPILTSLLQATRRCTRKPPRPKSTWKTSREKSMRVPTL